MSPLVYQAFEKIISATYTHGAVLEVGAIGGADSLLAMSCLHQASQKVGVNLEAASKHDGYEILQGNANNMHFFENNYFDLVMCNSTLEHDPYFWKTVSEMYRVTAKGGLIVIGVPGFGGMGVHNFAPYDKELAQMLSMYAAEKNDDVLRAGTVTLGEHLFPGDYYRFTEQAVREVFLEGLIDIQIYKVMQPIRIIGVGRKP